ncbi:MAG TPA: GatB/YqeY domain-containing protein [Pseudogracilibacillus sp.]|nr:GatB/YqeY domain-containing protein [Pseudogracilibacillus sp.]
MSLNKQLTEHMKEAMKEKDKTRLSVIRMLRAALQNEAINQGVDTLSEEDEIMILSRQVKQLNESIAEFKAANREDLVEKSEEELTILSQYMPAQLSDDELEEIVKQAIETTAASSKREFGKVMGAVMPQVKGKADGSRVQKLVQELLP